MDPPGPLPEKSQSPLEARHGGQGRGRGSGVARSARPRGLPKLMAINALVCGVEIVSSAAFTYIPPLLLKAGYTETVMTIILGVGESHGLVLQGGSHILLEEVLQGQVMWCEMDQ